MLALFWFFPGFLDFFDKKLDLIQCPVCLFALLGLYFVFFLSFFFCISLSLFMEAIGSEF